MHRGFGAIEGGNHHQSTGRTADEKAAKGVDVEIDENQVYGCKEIIRNYT